MRLLKGLVVLAVVSEYLGCVTSIAMAAVGDSPGGFLAPLYPGINVEERHDNNIFSQPTTAARTESWVTIVSPFLLWDSGLGAAQRYSVLYQADIGRYHSSSGDDYTDQRLLGKASFGFSDNGKLKLEAEYLEGHDPRGSGRSEGAVLLTSPPDEWHSEGITARVDYGSSGAPARVSVSAGHLSKHYDNNKPATDALERDNTDVGVALFYRVAPKTSLLLEITNTDIDYGSVNLDSTEQRYLGGVTWDITAPLSGTVKGGSLRKDFDAASRQDFSGGSWTVELRWKPLTYSVFDLSSSRKTGETYGVGDFILTKDAALTWTHLWTSQFKSIAGLRFSQDTYNDTAGRLDDIWSCDIKVEYKMRKWLHFGTGVGYSKRESNVNTYDYTRTIYQINAGIAL